MQMFLTACSHMLCHSTKGSELASDDVALIAKSQGVAAYATRLALTAVLRISRATAPETVASAFHLDKLIADIILFRKSVFSDMPLLLEVLVAILRGAGQADIEGVLPQLMRFTVGSSDTLQV